MNHLNNGFHRWCCASGSHKDYFLSFNNGILLQDINQLNSWISNNIANRYTENGTLANGQGLVHMPHKCLWGKFRVPCLRNRCLDDQSRSACFNMQWLKLWILFFRHTSMANDKWECKIDCWLIKSTQHSLHSLRWPSTIVCRSRKQASLGSCHSLAQEMKHIISAIPEPLITRLIIHAQMYFVILARILVLPCQRFRPKWKTISTAPFAEGSTQLVRTHRWHNLTAFRAALKRTSLTISWRSW